MFGLSKYLFDDQGSMSVELALWVPFMCFLLVIITDASFLYVSQNQMWNVARDTARRMTTKVLPDTGSAEGWAKSQLAEYDNDYSVDAVSEATYVSVVISTPVSGVVPFGLFVRAFLDDEVLARVVLRKHPT